MYLEQRRQEMLQLHLSDHQVYCLLRYNYITGLMVLTVMLNTVATRNNEYSFSEKSYHRSKYSQVPLLRGLIYHDITYNTAITVAE